MFTANDIATKLRKNGIPTRDVTEITMDYDGEIRLNDTMHVQVGERYLMLWIERTATTAELLIETRSVRALARKIKATYW